jgi:hypothetical protein
MKLVSSSLIIAAAGSERSKIIVQYGKAFSDGDYIK